MFSLKRIAIILGGASLVVGAVLFIPGVPQTPSATSNKETTASDSTTPASASAIDSATHGFWMGDPSKATKKVYVFFDPKCIHCKDLWNATLAVNRKEVATKWIPVGMLSPESITIASFIIGKAVTKQHPEAAMAENEAKFATGGIKGNTADTEMYKGRVRVNSEYLAKYSTSFPYSITEINGKVYTAKGSMTPPQWNTFIDTGIVKK